MVIVVVWWIANAMSIGEIVNGWCWKGYLFFLTFRYIHRKYCKASPLTLMIIWLYRFIFTYL